MAGMHWVWVVDMLRNTIVSDIGGTMFSILTTPPPLHSIHLFQTQYIFVRLPTPSYTPYIHT